MMTRTICVLLIAAVFVTLAANVSPAQPKWFGGLKAGVNVAQFRGDAVAPWVARPDLYLAGSVGNSLAGFVGGAFVRRQFTDRFALQLEGLYSQKGGDGTVYGIWEIEYPSDVVYNADINGQLSVRLDYVEFPLLAAFTLPSSDRVGLTVLLGPSVGYNTRAEARLEGEARVRLPDGSDRVDTFDERIPIHGKINRWEVAGVIGAALEFEMSQSTVLLDVRYTFGVTSIDKGNKDVYNHVLGITIGFMAPFQK